MAVFRIERTRDYTVMSNHHLRNANLSLKAKGLLSMMLSLPEDWNYTTRGLAKICKEGVDAIGAALRELEGAGYIVRHQRRDKSGRITDTEYVIYEQPQPDLSQPDTASPDTENPDMVKPDTEKPAELNIEKSNTEKSITYGSSTDSIPFREPAAARPPERKGRDAMSVTEIENYRDLILENIEYDYLCREFATYREDLDEIVELMVETVCARRKTTRIAGSDFPHEMVQLPFFEAGQRAYPVCHGLLAEKHHRGPQHEAVPADGAVQRTYHHQQPLHLTGQPRYERRRLVRPPFFIPQQCLLQEATTMNQMEIFNNPEFGSIRVIEENGKYLFSGTDVAAALGYSNPRDAIIRHCRYVVKRDAPHPQSPDRKISMTFIPEGDLYRLIVHSKLPSAEQFERWVFDEVLPTIRKHGAYLTKEKLWEIATSPEALMKLCSDLLAEREANISLRKENAQLEGKAAFYDLFIDLKHSTNLRTTAKELDVPERRFVRFLIERRFVYRTASGNVLPYANVKNTGLFCVKDYCNHGHIGSYTLVTPQGKLYFAQLREMILLVS